MTRDEYELKKYEQRAIYLSRVMAHGTDNEDEVLKEAVEKFEANYPPYEE